ncbi:hypothetical protein QR680_005180 [Steinernema hermaphroditum]|uniref:C2 domain-containing protein n=1 Tax=Steinernema hermaphroditum TaxID=289476 RepID=A0AA39HTB1_9BILA|nr:hypothetical protein QR680_005180 [Steinernema hermaphroditum]
METPVWPEPPQATLNDLLDALNRLVSAVESQTTVLNNLLNHFVLESTPTPPVAIRAPTPVPPRLSDASPPGIPRAPSGHDLLSPNVFLFDTAAVPSPPTVTATVPVSLPLTTVQGNVQTTVPLTVPLPLQQNSLQIQSPQAHIFQLKRLTPEALQLQAPPTVQLGRTQSDPSESPRTIVKTSKRAILELLSQQIPSDDSPDNSPEMAFTRDRFSRSLRDERRRARHASITVPSRMAKARSLSGRRDRRNRSMRETPFSTNSSPVVTLDQLLGKVRFAARYLDQKDTLIISELEGSGLELVDSEASSQVRIAFFGPRVVKHRTAFVDGPNPKFRDSFTFTHISQEELSESVLRLRIYRRRNAGRHQFLGESLLRTSLLDAKSGNTTHHSLHLHPNTDKNLNVFSPMQLMSRRISGGSQQSPVRNSPVLSCATPVHSAPSPTPSNSASRRNSSVDSCGRFCSLPQANGSPELLISLCYLETQGKVVVGLEKASGISSTNGKPRDTYIRVAVLTQYGEELGKHKTDVVRSANDPVYNDTAVFSIPFNELETSSIKVEVFSYCGVWRKKVPLGYMCLGENSTTPDQQEHWYQMIQGMGTTVSKWHHLLKPNDHPTLLQKLPACVESESPEKKSAIYL